MSTERTWWFPVGPKAANLDQIDGLITCLLLDQHHPYPTQHVLEIGVWQGAWIDLIIRNSDEATCYGVDPYPMDEDLETKVTRRLEAYNRQSRTRRYTHFQYLDEALSFIHCDDSRMNLIHVDGEHSYSAVARELALLTSGVLARGGIVVVDDYRHPKYPGVGAALWNFLSGGEFVPFLFTINKAYLCRKNVAGDHKNWMEKNVLRAGLRVEPANRGGYVQSPEVFGFTPLLVVDPQNYQLAKKRFQRRRLRSIMNLAIRLGVGTTTPA